MIDNFSLGLTHLLMLVAVWHLLRRSDLDDEKPQPDARAGRKDRPGA